MAAKAKALEVLEDILVNRLKVVSVYIMYTFKIFFKDISYYIFIFIGAPGYGGGQPPYPQGQQPAYPQGGQVPYPQGQAPYPQAGAPPYPQQQGQPPYPADRGLLGQSGGSNKYGLAAGAAATAIAGAVLGSKLSGKCDDIIKINYHVDGGRPYYN